MNYLYALLLLAGLLAMLAFLLWGKRRLGQAPSSESKKVEDVSQPSIKTDYFGNFIRSYQGQADDTRADVESIWTRIKVLLDPNRPNGNEDDATGVIENVPSLMNYPDGCGRVGGLVVGRVQSGKTRNYVGLLLKAFDEGWNTVLVLTSNNKMLARQTWNRLLGTGTDEGDIYNRGKATVTAMSNFVRNDAGEIDFTWTLADGEWRDDVLYVGVIQKEDDHLERFEHWVRTVGNNKLSKMRLLVIDDEADNATPNSARARDVPPMSDKEVLAMAAHLENSNPFVSDWIRSLTTLDSPTPAQEKAIVDFLNGYRHTDPYGNLDGFKHRVLRNAVVRGWLGLDRQTDDGIEMSQIVAEVFARRKTRGEPIRNKKNFVSLVLYALDFVPRLRRSTINRCICRILSREDQRHNFAFPFRNVAYVGYTATPYANLLNEDPLKNPISADFIKPLKTPATYFGLERIHGLGDDHPPS